MKKIILLIVISVFSISCSENKIKLSTEDLNNCAKWNWIALSDTKLWTPKAEALVEKEETASKLSYFIQQYATEGQEEDAWKKMISVASFLGPVFGFLGLLSNASVEENKYQIVQYYSRKSFLNSAQDEIKRIEKLQSQVKEENLQTEINYLRFLKKQIIMITGEIRLNKLRDNQQINEIRYYTSQHASLKDWKDTRASKSPANYHNIDYHKLFEEQK